MNWRFVGGQKKGSEPRRNHSIAVWYSRRGVGPGQDPALLELHVNLWRLKRRSNGLEVNALDLGFRVTNSIGIENVFLYVPFTLCADEIVDLTYLLMNAEIARAIFSDDVHPGSSAPNISTFPITIGTERICCYKIDVATDLAIEKVGGPPDGTVIRGTVIRFKQGMFDTSPDDAACYVRFRIYLNSAGQGAFFNHHDPTDRGLLSGYEEIEVVDFRFNESRNLPRAVINQMNGPGSYRFGLGLIHYFVIRDMTEELNLSHGDLRKCRTLESDVWTKYVDLTSAGTSFLRNAIIFNWRKDGGRSSSADFNALARFRKRRTDWRTIIISVGSLLVIGIIAGLLTQPVATTTKWLWSQVESKSIATEQSAANSSNSAPKQSQSEAPAKEEHAPLAAATPLNPQSAPKNGE